jgi:phosphopantothenoylcysteine decarboxylase / phosphopantothenate---cysteine ligase
MMLYGRKILVALTGGIACYKTPNVVRLLVKEGAEVQVVMTSSACKFITPLTLETVSRNPVATDLFPEGEFVSTRHIDIATWPDLILVAPATANFFGKVSAGISDDLLTTIICATPKPVMIAPSMNPTMWGNAITQRNVTTLRNLGYHFISPDSGDMACDHVGEGRMAEPERILETVANFFASSGNAAKKKLSGKRILVTAGPTREAIDPVRFLSNHSSGKMGYAIAEAARDAGAEVTLISGPASIPQPNGVRIIDVTTTDDMAREVTREFLQCDCLIMAAAPADFVPAEQSQQKIKKELAVGTTSLALKPSIDILGSLVGRKRTDQIVIGFALETENGEYHAKKKLAAKQLDIIVLNSPSSTTGFMSDTNQVTVISRGGEAEIWPLDDKRTVAFRLLDKIAELLTN